MTHHFCFFEFYWDPDYSPASRGWTSNFWPGIQSSLHYAEKFSERMGRKLKRMKRQTGNLGYVNKAIYITPLSSWLSENKLDIVLRSVSGNYNGIVMEIQTLKVEKVRNSTGRIRTGCSPVTREKILSNCSQTSFPSYTRLLRRRNFSRWGLVSGRLPSYDLALRYRLKTSSLELIRHWFR